MNRITFNNLFLVFILFLSLNGNTIAFENSIGIKFRVIPPGEFIMGSPKDEPGHEIDEKLHKVIITRAFLMAETETTQRQWLELMDYNPSSSTNRCYECPVESVSWNQVNDFINKLNQKEYTNKYRLPTEAEWEYACRAGTSSAFYTGKITATNCAFDKALDEAGWYCGNSGFKNPYYNFRPRPPGLKKPNRFGLYDMHGNLMEWCIDSTSWNSIISRYAGAGMENYIQGIKDPIGTRGDKKIYRGGSFVHSATMARAANRFFIGPKAKRNYIGFRLVKDIR